MAFVGFRNQFVEHDFTSISLGQACAHGRAFVIRHDVEAGAARLNFRLPDCVSEHFDHHVIQYTTGPVA